ncbi:MAG: glutamine--tRNA ligase/YqeY domain fusion protein [Kiritimatiellia bacterium]|jgi:glutaminyl-tRNA synthetase
MSTAPDPHADATKPVGNFLYQWIAADVAAGRHGGEVVTRFPPEPNGYLHIGHAKAICLDFGLAKLFGGRCHLRMDDTNPSKESDEYAESIKEDIRWLGFDWGEHFYNAADMFDDMYAIAENLIKSGHAYVCKLSQDEWKDYRGIPTEPGRESPWRNTPPEENLDLFRRMKAGEFPDGSLCLRAKIDMASPNIHFRDPVLYRILHVEHYHTGDTWCIYPMYDFAHPIEDALEGVTHSMCTLEFEVHRPLYDWVVDRMDEMGLLVVRNGVKIRPQQREFSRLNLTYTVMSKRLLLRLVEEGHVDGWDDPRMPTLCGMRRRGYPPASIRAFCDGLGATKFISTTDCTILEEAVREELNKSAPRRLAVFDPVKLVIDNYPDDQEETFDAVNNPEDAADGSRKIPFSKTLLVERADFMKDPPRKFHRLALGREVRLRYACLFTCTHVVEDDDGNLLEIHGTMDPESRGGTAPDGRVVRGTIHWVSERHAVEVPVRLYDRLFTVEDPLADGTQDFTAFINPDSAQEAVALAEPSVATLPPGSSVQFERMGYFHADPQDSKPGAPVFNRTASLRDSWSKTASKQTSQRKTP